MNEKATQNCIKLPLADLDRLLGHGDGNAALLYLHILRTGGFSLDRAARSLKCTEAELLSAAETLRLLGLLEGSDPALERTEAPEYTAEDLVSRAKTDGDFEATVTEAERALGKVLSSSDLKLLFGIYDYWGLPTDVILLLLHHCVERYEARYGQGRRPTMRYIEKEAQRWARMEITSLDAAEEELLRDRERRAAAGRIKEVLQIRGRELTGSESGYIESWIALGFSPEAVAIAYDRTVLSTGKLAWKYLDKILRSWSEKGLFTPEAIEAGDARRAPQKQEPPPERSDSEKLEAMRRMYAHIKEKGNGA